MEEMEVTSELGDVTVFTFAFLGPKAYIGMGSRIRPIAGPV